MLVDFGSSRISGAFFGSSKTLRRLFDDSSRFEPVLLQSVVTTRLQTNWLVAFFERSLHNSRSLSKPLRASGLRAESSPNQINAELSSGANLKIRDEHHFGTGHIGKVWLRPNGLRDDKPLILRWRQNLIGAINKKDLNFKFQIIVF